jgi:hypothetical protein
MNLYYATAPAAAERILARGFSRADANGAGNGAGKPGRILLSDREPGPGDEWQTTILLDLPEPLVEQFELPKPGDRARTFLVPADVVDRYPVLAVRGMRANGAGGVALPRRLAGRKPLVVAGLAALALAAGGGALATFVLDDDGGGSTAPDRSAAGRAQRPAAPTREAAPSAPESRAIGRTTSGRLVGGVPFPRDGTHFFTWDAVRGVSPNRKWRRYGTAATVETVLEVLQRYAGAHPKAARVGIADISRRHGGDFGVQFGGRGHTSHQNGLDVDVLYPRLDGRERAPDSDTQVDRRLAQDLVDLFIRAGARVVFVDPHLGLTGPRRIVRPLAYHDDHMHVRFPKR